MVIRCGASVLCATVYLAETSDTHSLAQVDVASDCSSARVEPIDVLRREFFEVTGLDSVGPRRDGESTLAFEELRCERIR